MSRFKLRNLVYLALLCGIVNSSSLNAADAVRTEDDLPKPTRLPTEGIASDGYPTQEKHRVGTLPVYTTTVIDDFTFLEANGIDMRIPEARINYTGEWKKIGTRRVAKSGEKESYSYSNSMGVSKSTAHEVSVGLSVAVSGGFKPFGVGVDVEVSASVGYAYSIANETSSAQEWTHSVDISPGEEVELWSRAIEVTAEYDWSMVPGEDDFEKYAWWQANVVGPSLERHTLNLAKSFQKVNKDSEIDRNHPICKFPLSVAEEFKKTTKQSLLKDPAKIIKAGAEIPNLKRKSFEAGPFLLPAKETYTVRYKF